VSADSKESRDQAGFKAKTPAGTLALQGIGRAITQEALYANGHILSSVKLRNAEPLWLEEDTANEAQKAETGKVHDRWLSMADTEGQRISRWEWTSSPGMLDTFATDSVALGIVFVPA
jgi:hypothetical protein